MRLSKEEKEVAEILRKIRPQTLPGTNAIIDRKAAIAWYGHVTQSMNELGLIGERRAEFCDVAGARIRGSSSLPIALINLLISEGKRLEG